MVALIEVTAEVLKVNDVLESVPRFGFGTLRTPLNCDTDSIDPKFNILPSSVPSRPSAVAPVDEILAVARELPARQLSKSTPGFRDMPANWKSW